MTIELIIGTYLITFIVFLVLMVRLAPEGEETENGFRYIKKKGFTMKAKKYFTLIASVIVFAFLEALIWEHLLAVLITAFVCLSILYISNNKMIKRNNELKEKMEKFAQEKNLAIEQKRKIDEENTLLRYGIKRLEKELKEFTDKYKEAFNQIKKPYDFSFPQSEASKKLGACTHNKIKLEKINYEHE